MCVVGVGGGGPACTGAAGVAVSVCAAVAVQVGVGVGTGFGFHSAAVAGGANTNHDYTNATGNTLRLQNVVCCSTVATKYDVQLDPTGVAGYPTYWVGFTS